jgi:hypothetical protein
VARTTLEAAGRAYTVNFDDSPRAGDRYQSIVIAQLVDEITGNPITGTVRVETDLIGARPKSVRDGICGAAGIPSRLFPELDAQAYEFGLSFEVDGFVPFDGRIVVPQQPNFPDEFTGVDLGLLDMRRMPVTIVVRALQLDSQNRPVPLPGATVEISSIWRTTQDLSGAPSAPDIISLRPSLYAERPQPGTTLEPVTMTPIAEPERLLMRPTEPGANVVEVGRTGGLASGSIIAFDEADADRAEYIEVDNVVGPSDPESPAALTLAFSVQNRHPQGAPVQEVTVAALGPPAASLGVAGRTGDATAFVDSVGPFATRPVVRISGGAPPDEFVTALPYQITTGGDGYGVLPPLTRVAAIEIVASAPGPLTADATRFTPSYGEFHNHFQLVLE